MDNLNDYTSTSAWKVAFFSTVVSCALLGGSMQTIAQTGLIPEKYLRIIPGVSTRTHVDELYSKRDPTKHFVDYDASDFSVGIKYSLGSCELRQGIWGFPEWTVEEVYYNWPNGKKIRLREIILDPNRFEKRETGDTIGQDYYFNDEFGIIVVYDRKTKSVVDLGIKPAARLKEKYGC